MSLSLTSEHPLLKRADPRYRSNFPHSVSSRIVFSRAFLNRSRICEQSRSEGLFFNQTTSPRRKETLGITFLRINARNNTATDRITIGHQCLFIVPTTENAMK